MGEFFLQRDKTRIDGKQLRPILDRVSFVKYSTTASTFVVQPEQLPINTAMVGIIITYLTEGIPQSVTNEWDLWSDHIQKIPTDAIDPAGGARARVKEVKILDVDATSVDDRPLGLLFHARWTAMGSVGHWGHIHMRKNQYEANISVEPVDGAWKITGLELLEEKRIDPYANPEKGRN